MMHFLHSFLLSAFFTGFQSPGLSIAIAHKDIGSITSPSSISANRMEKGLFPNYTTTLWYNSVTDPSIAVNPVNGTQLVAAWVQDRFSDTGGLEIGIGYSFDGGENWQSTTIPFQKYRGGILTGRVFLPKLAYSSDGSCVYLTVLQVNGAADSSTNAQNGVLVACSQDHGQTWSVPEYLVSTDDCLQHSGFYTVGAATITADKNLPEIAYVTWDQFTSVRSYHADTWMSRTTTKGSSWEEPRLIYNPSTDSNLPSNSTKDDRQTINNTMVELENGDLLCFMTRIYPKPDATVDEYRTDSWPYKHTLYDIACVRSSDKGLTWTPNATQVALASNNINYTGGYTIDADGSIKSGNGQALLTASKINAFKVAVNPVNGAIYVVWETSLFTTPGNQLSQIALTVSRDNGETWSTPLKVNRTPATARNPLAFTPSIAVTSKGKIGILYHDFRISPFASATETKTNAWLALYKDTGSSIDFIEEARLTPTSYSIEKGPIVDGKIATNGHSNSMAAHGNTFYPLFIKANKGPFRSQRKLIDNPSKGTLILDQNKRTSPIFASIKAA